MVGSIGASGPLEGHFPSPASERAGASGRVSNAPNETDRPVEKSAKASPSRKSVGGGQELTEAEERQIRELKKRDAEVKAHERAHANVGGIYASAPRYEYTVGPDGKRYAISGEVQIDATPVRDDPEATIRKMDIVIRTALAPAEPSAQDLAVARQAQAERDKARAELLKSKQADSASGSSDESSDRLVASGAYAEAAAAIEAIASGFSAPSAVA